MYPTHEQEIFFQKTFGCCRKIWNLMLCSKDEYYKANQKMLDTTPAMYKDEYPYLREVDSLALSNVQLDLESAYRKFFNKETGFPKYKSKHKSGKSYTTNNQKGSVWLTDKGIHLPKMKKNETVKIVLHREPPKEWKLKSATVSQKSDGTYYVSVLFELPCIEKESVSIETDRILGLDYKSDGLYMDSNNTIGTNHKYFRESQKKLARLQRSLSKKKGSKKGEAKSKNWLKQKKKVNKLHTHIANQRLDNLHKISLEIANHYDIVCVESLNMKSISNKGFRNGKATMDNGYGMFLNLLEYKLNDRGKYFVKVDKWFPSSQICRSCGCVHKLELRERVYVCPECGNTIDRDYQAAMNIRDEGLRILKDTLPA